MRAVRFHSFGDPSVLRVDDVPVPVPSAGQVCIDVSAAGINFADTERRRGLYLANAPLPVTTGFEGAGVVCSLGPGVDSSWLGQRVAFLGEGSVAESCVASVEKLISLPASLTDIDAAAFPVQGLTAWHVLHTSARLQPNETVFVTAAAGGVGQLVIQLARAHGADVVGMVSSEAKRFVVEKFGARVVVGTEVNALENSVDVFIDSVGRDVAELAFSALKPFGRWVHFGNSSGATPGIEPERLLEKSLSLSGWWLRTPHAPKVWQRGLDEVLHALVTKTLVLDPHVISMADVADAHRSLEDRTSTGKFVVVL